MNPEKVAENRKRVRDALKEVLPGRLHESFEDEDCDLLFKKRCTTPESLSSPGVLKYLKEGPDPLPPALVILLEERAKEANKRPLPTAARSYTNNLREWQTEDNGVHFKVHKLLHETAEGSGDFCTFWTLHQAAFENMTFKLRFCHSEQTINSYEDCGKKMLQPLFKFLHDAMGFVGNDRTGQSLLTLFFNQVGANGTRPDVAVCGKDPGSAISSDEQYKFMIKCVELKPDLQSAPSKGLIDGMGEVIARADQARAERDIASFILPGMVTDNRLLRAMVVHASQIRKQQYLEIGENLLWLVPEDSPKDATFGQNVDTKGVGFKEVVFLCWRAAVLRLRKAAESPKLDIPGDGLHISVRASDGAPFLLLLQEQLSEPGAPYLVCSATARNHASTVIVKMGPPSGTVAGAKGLAISTEEFLQVETETMMLERLRPRESPFLPHLVCSGHVAESSVQCLLGRPVVVTSRQGRPLIGPGGALPVLGNPELLRLAADVLAGIRELQAASISHNDLRPQNLGASKTGYYIYDLGAATLLDADENTREHACSLLYSSTRIIQGKHPKEVSDVEMLLYSLMKLAGNSLPWEDAAAEGDWLGCYTERMQLARSHVLPETIQRLPDPLPAFARQLLKCVAKGGSVSWIAGWVPHLRAEAARLYVFAPFFS